MKNNFYIFALGALGRGLSGSDRIFIEFARRWSAWDKITIYVWSEGQEMCKRQRLGGKNINFSVSKLTPWSNPGFIANYFARILEGIRLGFTLKLNNATSTVLYNASDFWMDTLPCFILKLRHPKVKWVATWYQTAPNPLTGFAEGSRSQKYRFKALLYWLSQLPIKPIISRYADFVLVNNESETKQFPNLQKKGKVVVVFGAVDVAKINKWTKKVGSLPKIYDAVFQGRLHPQKGPVELIEIWRRVVYEKPNAKLAMLGDGPLMKDVQTKIKKLKLSKNVKLFGYVFDGPQKYKIFSQSKVVVHPAFYDSGGMASAEAMAFGIPCVGFDLKSYRSYYPKGMLKVKTGDLEAFAGAIIELIDDDKHRQKLGKEAHDMITKNWSWDTRAKQIYDQII